MLYKDGDIFAQLDNTINSPQHGANVAFRPANLDQTWPPRAAKMAPNLDPLNHSKTTPLHLACGEGWLDVVRFLLGQNVNFPTSATRDFMKGTDKTPLFALVTESSSHKNQGEGI